MTGPEVHSDWGVRVGLRGVPEAGDGNRKARELGGAGQAGEEGMTLLHTLDRRPFEKPGCAKERGKLEAGEFKWVFFFLTGQTLG